MNFDLNWGGPGYAAYEGFGQNNGDDADIDLQDVEEGGVQPDTDPGDQTGAPDFDPLAGAGGPLAPGDPLGNATPQVAPQAAPAQGGWTDLAEAQAQGLGGGFGSRLKQIMLGGMGPSPSMGPSITQRHGGFLTGLAGVLIDGLAAGLATPQGARGGFSASAAAGMNIQQQRQQQAQIQQQLAQMSPQQRQQFQQLQAQTKQKTGTHMTTTLPVEDQGEMARLSSQFYGSLASNGLINVLERSSNAQAIAQSKNAYAIQNGPNGANVWNGIFGVDDDNTPDDYGVFEVDPNKKLDQPLTVPGTAWKDEDGNVQSDKITFPAGMSMGDVMAKWHDVAETTAHDFAMLNDTKNGKVTADVLGPYLQRRAMEDEQEDKDIAKDKTYQDLLKEYANIQQAKKPAATGMEKQAGAEIRKAYENYSNIDGQIRNVAGNLKLGVSGNQVANAIAPLQGTLLTISGAGVHRINTTELDMNLPGAGDLVRNMQAKFDRWTSGTLPGDYVKDLQSLLSLYRQTNENRYKTSVDSANQRWGTDIPYGLPGGTGPSPRGSETFNAPNPRDVNATAKVGGKTIYHLGATGQWVYQDGSPYLSPTGPAK
jgi:hypothetical protein